MLLLLLLMLMLTLLRSRLAGRPELTAVGKATVAIGATLAGTEGAAVAGGTTSGEGRKVGAVRCRAESVAARSGGALSRAAAAMP